MNIAAHRDGQWVPVNNYIKQIPNDSARHFLLDGRFAYYTMPAVKPLRSIPVQSLLGPSNMFSVLAVLSVLGATGQVSAQNVTGRKYVWHPVQLSVLEYFLVVAPKTYPSLPLGAIKPTGWLHDQVSFHLPATLVDSSAKLMVQTNGLAGHEHDFYD